jgi:hypothetical protein
VAANQVARRERRGRRAVGVFVGFAVVVCSAGALYGSEVVGVSRLRGVLAGILGGLFYATVYIASRAPSLRPFRKFISGSTGLICGYVCAGLLGRGTAAEIVCGLIGLTLGVGAAAWLPAF